jgi:hypothetical protein
MARGLLPFSVMPDSPANRDRFPIELRGKIVECFTLDDAVAIRMADAILSGSDPTPYSAERLKRLTTALVRYGQRDIAEQLAIHLGRG